MLNIILKDLSLGKSYILMVISWWCGLIYISNGRAGASTIVSLVILFQALLLDDQYKTGPFFLSLPLKRSTIVLARYLLVAVVIAFMPVLSYTLNVLLNSLFPLHFDQVYPFSKFIRAQFSVAFFVSLAYPVHFRYGSNLEGGMKAIAILFTGTFLLILGLAMLFIHLNFNPMKIDNFFLYMSVLIILLLTISMIISLRVFNKRDF